MSLHFSAYYLFSLLVAIFSFLAPVSAQSSTQSATDTSFPANGTVIVSGNATLSLSTFLSLATSSATTTTVSRSGNRDIPITTVVPVIFNVTATATSTIAASSTTISASATPTADPSQLDTRIDPAFGVLGAILILTGLPSAFLGHKNRWTSFFLVGFYSLSLVCIVLILKFGVLRAVNPPTDTLRGLFVLASCVAGIAGGGITIFFWKATRYFIGGWGGFAFALWIQCFRNGGLITPIGLRWIMYIGCAVVGFVLCTIPKIHYHVLLISTAFVGATSFMLGVDCYTTANLKEFYIWNIGFTSLFPRFLENNIKFPVTQSMQIELGLLGAVTLMGMAVQFQILKILQRKLQEIREEQRRLDEVAVARAAERFASLDQEKEEWDRAHPSLAKHGRNDSAMTATTGVETGSDEKRASVFTLELNRAASRQTPGALPVLDLGTDLEEDVPQGFIAESSGSRNKKDLTLAELEDLKKKEGLLAEIQAVRRSIEILKSDTPAPSSSEDSRHASVASRRTASHDPGTMTAGPSHLRPPRQPDPRTRAYSEDLSHLADLASSIGRPVSAPLRDDDWDAYVRERKLLQPPSGVTAPIPTTPIGPAPRLSVSSAVTDALLERRRRESALSVGQANPLSAQAPPDPQDVSSPPPREDVVSAPMLHKKSHSQGANVPVMILPPQTIVSPTPKRPEQPRTKTFEELAERHREMIRQMQAPLTQAEKEQTELAEAKRRWGRAKEMEKRAVTKRQTEQAAALSKEGKKKHHKSGDILDGAKGRSTSPGDDPRTKSHSRSLSADLLASVPKSTRKVDEWQRNQLQDLESGIKPERPEPPSSKRRSAVPFPDHRQRSTGIHRDPIS
ncbi:unnamed protein product [Somion occarium]|uniref:TM7S3/TM198-like domain-containing protein n=1 Tax=Somion occarium TaxID=3059160 RepID=A0ABP1CHY1_9APHY